MKRASIIPLGLGLLWCAWAGPGSGGGAARASATPAPDACVQAAAVPPISFTVLLDGSAFRKGLRTGADFSCLIQGGEKTILFDTGADGRLLLENFAALKLDPADVDLVVISHALGNHAAGLLPFLAKRGPCQVFLPASAPADLVKQVEAAKGQVELVKDPLSVCEGVFSTGPVLDEQGLVVDTPQGLVVLTGCAHPDVAGVVAKARSVMPKEIYLVMGGFRLADRRLADLEATSRRLRELGVIRLAAAQCAGARAIAFFKRDFGKNYLELGAGREIDIR